MTSFLVRMGRRWEQENRSASVYDNEALHKERDFAGIGLLAAASALMHFWDFCKSLFQRR